MKRENRKAWAVCVDGSPVVIRKGQRAAWRALGEFRRALPDLDMTVEPVAPVVRGDFVLYERVV